MNQRNVRAWLMYDWANSAYATTILAAVLPIFYGSVAASHLDDTTASSYLAFTHSIGMLCVALMAPILGAVSDLSGRKVTFLRWFSLLGIIATLGFAFVGPGDWMLASFLLILSTIGFAGGNTFYDSLLPDLVPLHKRDYISSKGYAFGYIGGAILLAINLLMIQKFHWFGLPNELSGTRLAFVSVALWWFIFSLPIFKRVPNNPRQAAGLSAAGYVSAGVRRLGRTFGQIRRFPQLVKFLIAFWFFNDGINTIILMAAIYGESIGIGTSHLILALLITQIVGIPATLLLGKAAEKIGSKNMLYITLSIYLIIVILGYFMTSALHFYTLATLVGCVQGASQAIARSIFSSLIPIRRTGEFFGLVNVTSKFSSIFGPFVFGLVGKLTGSSRLAILSLILFFVVGIIMMMFVNVKKGIQDAEELDQLDALELGNVLPPRNPI
jgi:UMF1 family MFS transporter